jgi:PKD domain
MAVAFRAAGTLGTSTAGAATVVPYPAGVASGDLLILQFIANATSTPATPSGWTALFGPTTTTTYGNKCYVFWRVAGGSEPSTVSVTISTGQGAGIMSAFTGANTSAPINVHAEATLPGGGTSPTMTTPSVTTTVANTMLLRMYWAHDGTAVAPAGTDTEIYDANAPGQPCAIEAATSTQTAAGASGTTTATLNSNKWGGLGSTIAIAPATAVTPAADFTGTPLTGVAPYTVTFTDASTNTPTSWAWTFGDGGTSSSQNPTHSYTVPGVYTVALVATNAAGSDTKTRTGYVTVNSGFVPQITII